MTDADEDKETVIEEEKTSDESDEEYRKRISEMVMEDTSEEDFKGGFDE